MKTKLGKFVSVLSMLGLLASCAQMGPLEAQNANARKAAESATTYADHERLAKQYENSAKESLVKAEEQQKLLQHYEEKSYLYGRQAQDFKSHTEALLHKYQQTAEENIKQASFHHKVASELTKTDYANQGSNRKNKARIGTDSEDWQGNSGKAL
ncbi:MAG: hypothetical protein ABIN99_09885 [Nitrosospira sp.]